MDDYVLKLQEDLRKRLDRLCWMHNEPALHMSEYFAELRRQVDFDAEQLISEIQSVKYDNWEVPKDSDVNETRLEFIRILNELEKRTGHQPKPETVSSKAYLSLEQRVDGFKDSSSSLDDLEETYVQLAQEIIDETNRLEKRILGEQTIIYWLHEDEIELGSLVYLSDVFLNRQEIECLIENETRKDSLLVPAREPNELSKSKQVFESLADKDIMFEEECKFFHVAKTKEEYTGYSAEGSSLDRKFVSYQYKTSNALLHISKHDCVDTSANLFDVYSSTNCQLEIKNRRLDCLHANLLPSPPNRLSELILVNVHFDSFDMDLLATFTNLTCLVLLATYSKSVKFDLAFLGALRNLTSLYLALPDTPSDLSMFKELTELKCMALESTSFVYAEQLPKLSKAVLEQILSPPHLQSLKLACFDIEAIDREMLSECKRLQKLDLSMNRIGSSNSALDIGFPACFPHSNAVKSFESRDSLQMSKMSLFRSGIRTLGSKSFAGMSCLQVLSLKDNSIVDLPPGVFDDLSNLDVLDLDKNLIRHVRCGVFNRLTKVKELTMTDNPIESIDAKAFDQLIKMHKLCLSGCRLKSIDSEMFVGLDHLSRLSVDNNRIERIEVVAEDGRRINVAKADLNDEEKELVEKHLFKRSIHLSDLDLSHNKLKKLDLNCFSNLESLQNLDLSSNNIEELSGVAGPELLRCLRKLSLNANQLTIIENTTLPKNLNELDLSENKLKRLDDDFFTRFEQLETINLEHNELTMTITDATFASCRHCLVEIDLSHNESISATPEVFLDMPYLQNIEYDFSEHFASIGLLKTLRIRKLTPECLQALQNLQIDESDADLAEPEVCCLSNCSIEQLMRNTVEQCEFEAPETVSFSLSWLPSCWCVKEVDFSGNLIETLDDADLFAGFEFISKFNLSGNRLKSIHRDIFKGLGSLSAIDLSGNKLASIDMGLFRHLKILRDLNLSSNNISFLNLARLFRICPSLQSLNIADNQLDDRSTVEPIDARFLCDLQKLNMANNRFVNLHLIRDMTSLQHLDLRGNKIESVMSYNGENMLGRLFSLTYLDLSGNLIRSLRDEMFTHLCGRLKHFDISSNPLDIQLDSVLSELV